MILRRLFVFVMALFAMIGGHAQTPMDYLLPVPQNILLKDGHLQTNKGRLICVNSDTKQIKIATTIQKFLAETNIKVHLAAQKAYNEKPLVELAFNKKLGPQAYSLTIDETSIKITGGDAAGLYYGSLTLSQLKEFARDKGYWPCIEIKDKPDFERRGVMLDISRDKVPTMETLYALVDELASWKINEFQLYTEHTFAYKNHRVVWEKASALTAEEILLLDVYCKDHYIALVPNQNSFGHMEKWLKHEEYVHLAELPEPGKTKWGMSSRKSISPAVSGSLELMEELYAELLPNFSSKYFNIGCDETVELGVGKSKNKCNNKGTGRVYVDFLLHLREAAKKHNKTIQFWGDIILHHPELIPELPKDMIALVWGYEENHPFDKQCAQFEKAKIPFYVCPGTSAWGTLIGRNKNAFANLLNAAINGKKYNATGFLNTSWGDMGHWQPLSVSYPGFLYGAALSWQVKANANINVGRLISRYVYDDPTGISGEVVVNLGNAYLKTGVLTDNSNIFHQLLRLHDKNMHSNWVLKNVTENGLVNAQNYIAGELKRFQCAHLNCKDAEIVAKEIIQAASLAQFACEYGRAKLHAPNGNIKSCSQDTLLKLNKTLQQLLYNHKEIWLMRNRIGGLDNSVEKMEEIINYLQSHNK